MEVPVESFISPGGTVRGLPEKSLILEDYIEESERTQCYTRTGSHELLVNSCKTPWSLPGLYKDYLWTPWLSVA